MICFYGVFRKNEVQHLILQWFLTVSSPYKKDPLLRNIFEIPVLAYPVLCSYGYKVKCIFDIIKNSLASPIVLIVRNHSNSENP